MYKSDILIFLIEKYKQIYNIKKKSVNSIVKMSSTSSNGNKNVKKKVTKRRALHEPKQKTEHTV